jgi:CheY-like chemotaxis protein
MTVLLASTELDLLSAAKFALECRGFRVMLATRAAEIANFISANGVNIVALDAAMNPAATPKMVQQIKDDQRFADTALILFASSSAQLRGACADRGILNLADDVVVDMFDESDLVNKVGSAARRLRIEKSHYHRQNAGWKDPYEASSFEERRKEQRFPLEAPVTVKGKDKLGEPFEEETFMINVSGGGACFKSAYHLNENTGLEATVRMPDVLEGILDLRGTVVRAEQGDDRHEAKRRRVGVRFNDDVQQSMVFHLALAKMSGLTYTRRVD